MCAPLRAARLAASTFVSMPPRRAMPAGPPAMSSSAGSPARASRTSVAAGIPARVGGVEARGVGQDHQDVGLDQVRDQRGQRVVVADADLVGHDGVVLVDDRDDAEREQRPQRRSRVQVALRSARSACVSSTWARADECSRKQSRRPAPVPSGRPRPRPAARASRGAASSSRAAACPRRSRRSRPARSSLPVARRRAIWRAQFADRREVEALAAVGDERAADLDDEPLSLRARLRS